MTKKELQKILLRLIEPLKTHYSKGKAELDLGAFTAGYGNKIANMEGFSRVLWGIAPYWAGGGVEDEFLQIYRTGFVNGTDPTHKEYWGDLGDRDQRMVEMAAISFHLLLTPELIWDTLSTIEQDNLASWLYQINLYTQPDNNWQFFNVITNLALKSVNKPYDKERMQYAIDRYEAFYLGNGWYADGLRPQKDYYISFAIHFYCLLYAKFMEEEPERCNTYKERARIFAKDFIYWFDDEGKALPFGRSQTYRFAQAAFWSVYVFAEVETENLGVVKGIISRHIKHWMKQPIFDTAGILTVGYTYPNLLISEGYNAPGSPYWALKFFAILALPEDHPFWSIDEEILPELEDEYCIPECNMLIQHRKGEVVALTAGQYSVVYHTHNAEKYAKFAYSSRLGFSIPRSYYRLEECAPDSMLTLYANNMYYVRRECMEYQITKEGVYSKWSPIKGIQVETTLLPTKNGHIREHKIISDIVCTAYDCGFSYPFISDIKMDEKEGYAYAGDENGYSIIQSQVGEGVVLPCAPNTNLIFPITVLPSIKYSIVCGEQIILSEVVTEFRESNIGIGKGDCYELHNK